MALSTQQRDWIRSVGAPGYQETRTLAIEWMARKNKSAADLAFEIGLGRSTMLQWLQGRWASFHPEMPDPEHLTAKIFTHIGSHPHQPTVRATGRLLPTVTYGILRERLELAVEEGATSVIYGPPGAEKSFGFEHLIAERQAAGKDDVLYVYCSQSLSPLSLLKRLAVEAKVFLRTNMLEPLRQALLEKFDAMPYPPAIVADEAQHLPVETIEVLRELHDRSKRRERKGCGVILAGSHTLLSDLLRIDRRPRLEQLLSRFPHRQQLTGMLQEEVLTLAAREMGNGHPAKFTDAQKAAILQRCQVQDKYSFDCAGCGALWDVERNCCPKCEGTKALPRNYYSCRRLVEYLEGTKRSKRAAKRGAA